MAPRLFIFLTFSFIQVLFCAGQSAIKQYLHVTGMGPHAHSAGLANMPTVGLTRQAVPSAGLATLPNSGIGALPNTGLAALSALALPGLLQALSSSAATQQHVPTTSTIPTLKTQPSQQLPSVPTSKQNPLPLNTPNGGLDSSVLNNLAIALQLLIVSNILNSNLPENESNPIYEMLETVKNIPNSLSQTQNNNYASSSQPQSYQEQNLAQIQSYSDPYQVPNVNFVASSGFSDHTISDPYVKPTSRNSFQLMSPYEALGPNSPFADPILASPYGSIMSSKKDFQSPYTMMDSDPFSMSDLF